MGGVGSGSYPRWKRKGVVEAAPGLNVLDLNKHGALGAGRRTTWAWSGGMSVSIEARDSFLRLSYNVRLNGGPWHRVEESITISWTKCNYGGSRPWMHCPQCQRRVVILYLTGRFLCRRCGNLSYQTQNERCPGFRLLMRARKIRQRLGMNPDSDAPIIWKPKWMRWHTFSRLALKERAIQERAWGMIGSSLPWR